MKIRELKKGDYFTLKNTSNSPLWIRGDYVREAKAYSCYKYDDICHENLIKGTREVFEPKH